MDSVIKNVTIIHDGSEFHLKTMDIHISKGVIKRIANDIQVTDAEYITGNTLYCCIGLCDIGTQSGEPGYENRETINTLTKSALLGGYTTLVVFPNNKPVTQTKADIRYLAEHPDRNGVEIFPVGALSKDTKGVDIAEYFDMSDGGAVAFSDGYIAVQDTGLLSRALQYTVHTGKPLIHHAEDHFLSNGGEMHEGIVSTSLGLKGVPDIAEVHMVQRDLMLCKYNHAGIIEHMVSAAGSVEAIRTAKKELTGCFATVPYLNLIFTDEDLLDFDSNLKVKPELRSSIDKKALIEGLNDDTIDAIVSNHVPLDEESKKLEFPYAAPGAAGLETCLPACLTYLENVLSLPALIHKLTIRPRSILQLPIPVIKEGQIANLCLFDTESSYQYQPKLSPSKSVNNPFADKQFTARVVRTFVG